MSAPALSAVVLDGLEDARLSDAQWDRLSGAGDTNAVFLTRAWQTAWWGAFGRGALLPIALQQAGEFVALAPLFCDAGMVFFAGAGGSDYLDFIGDVGGAGALETILTEARRRAPGFVGFRFHHVPDCSRTGARLQDVAGRLGLACYDEGDLAAPALDLADGPAGAPAAADKASLVRHERGFRREAPLDVRHLRGAEIGPHLDAFFEQHIARRAATPHPSQFLDPKQREFFRRLVRADDAQWLRFTRIDWRGRPIAFHFGFCRAGVYMWYKPSFDIALARRSPGEVLIRQLLLEAAAERARVFDFGLGDEPFKHRFATRVERVRTWGLYPADATPAPNPQARLA